MSYCIVSCHCNFNGGESVTVFSFHDKNTENDIRLRWIKCINRKYLMPTETLVEREQGKRYCHIKKLKPVPVQVYLT